MSDITTRILGESVRPPTKEELNDPRLAYSYALTQMGGRWPEGEATIATHPTLSLFYALYVVRGRWPEGESSIAKTPAMAFRYAAEVINDRFIEAEFAISNSPKKDEYLRMFPEARSDWLANGWIDWMDA